MYTTGQCTYCGKADTGTAQLPSTVLSSYIQLGQLAKSFQCAQDLKFARARGQQVLEAYYDASQSVDMVPTQATQHQRQVMSSKTCIIHGVGSCIVTQQLPSISDHFTIDKPVK